MVLSETDIKALSRVALLIHYSSEKQKIIEFLHLDLCFMQSPCAYCAAGAHDTAHVTMLQIAVPPSLHLCFYCDKHPNTGLLQQKFENLLLLCLAGTNTDHTWPLSAVTLKSFLPFHPLHPLQSPRVRRH